MTDRRLVLDPTACDGHGLCHDLVPEAISLDDWGYPIVSVAPLDASLLRHARRAVAVCPRLALHLVMASPPVPPRRTA
jgi:ferredoxin